MNRLLCLLTVLFIPLPGVAPAAAAPQLVVDPASVDLGEILQGDRGEHLFILRNGGDQTLVIQQVRSSCGCTAALLSAKEIPPGKTGELKATFNSRGFRGAVQKTITLYTNEARAPAVLRLQARVLPLIDAEPAELTLDPPVAGRRPAAEVILVNRTRQEVPLDGAYATNPLLQVQLEAGSIPAGGRVSLSVGSAGETGGESLSGYVMVRTGSPQVPELRIAVYGPAEAGL